MGETESGWRTPSAPFPVWCLAIWTETNRTQAIFGMRSGGSGEELGEGVWRRGAPFPKGLKGWMCAMYVWEQSNWNAGILFKSVPGNLHTLKGNTSWVLHLRYNANCVVNIEAALSTTTVHVWQIYDTLLATTKTIRHDSVVAQAKIKKQSCALAVLSLLLSWNVS